MRGRFAALALVAVLAACASTGASAPDPNAAAHLMRMDELAAGKLDAIPSGNLFARIQLFQQPPGAQIASKKHQVGIIYQQAGTQVLQYLSGDLNGQTKHITAGSAVFLESVYHSHTNDGSTTNTWYNSSLWSSSQRGTPLTQVVFETEDIPASDFPAGSFVESLRRVILQAGGRSPSHEFSGVEVLYLIEGSLTVKIRGHEPVHLAAGQGTFVAPGTVTQEIAGGSASTYLAFFVAPAGKAFETLSTKVP